MEILDMQVRYFQDSPPAGGFQPVGEWVQNRFICLIRSW